MNIFGFLATVVICATVIGTVWFLNKYPVSIKIIRTTEAPKIVEAVKTHDNAANTPEETTEIISKASMDEVIRAANELMGIETEVEDDR